MERETGIDPATNGLERRAGKPWVRFDDLRLCKLTPMQRGWLNKDSAVYQVGTSSHPWKGPGSSL